MSRAIFFVVMMVFSLSQASICPADEPTNLLKKLGVIYFGEEEKAGTLKVDSEPQGASVFVDNVLKGKTPCSLEGIAPGTLTVLVELEGYVPQDKELEIKPGETTAVEFKLEKARADAATAVALSADPESPIVKGTAVTFKAKGSGGTGKYEYRFYQKGPGTGEKWVKAQDYSPKDTWTWKTEASDVGTTAISVHVRCAGSTAEREALKRMSYTVGAVAPATDAKLSADPESPTVKGTVVTVMAAGSGGTGKYEYRFFKKGPGTGEKWVKAQDYSRQYTWTWKTEASDVGKNAIAVQIRSVGSKADKEVQNGMTYEVKAAK